MRAAILPGLICCACSAWTQAPAPPRSFEAIAASPTEIHLYWLPTSGATSYKLQRDGRDLATLPANTTEYDDTGLAADSVYRYTVQGIHDSSASPAIPYTERTFAPFPTGTAAFDVVVVQASSGGVAAAYEAARRGLKVALVESTTRLGGMPANGLSATDLRRGEHASGFFVRFRDRVKSIYAGYGIKADGIKYEPLIAHQAVKSLLYETPNLTIYRRSRLTAVRSADLPNSPGRRRVEGIRIGELDASGAPTGRNAELRAQVFIDSTDCGDLAAWAGAPYRLGREARSPQEPHNGVIYYDRAHDKLLPGSTGRGDRRIQAYTYLLTVKDYGPGADRTIPMPPGYRKEDFVHSPAWKDSWAVTSGKMPNDKYELNQHPQGGDIQGINYDYPTRGYRERARIDLLHRNHVLGYLYYIQTEQGQRQIGLPDDEYRDTGGFPPLLYVREGRRILGEQLPTEVDITRAPQMVRPESIGLGDYPMDSHAVRPKTDWTTPDMGEGEWWLYEYTQWHELPLGILIPRTLDNVFVTTAVSSTHVSFGTYRLEPVRMAFGEAAGAAAAICLRFGLAARDVPARQVQEALLPHIANPYGDEGVILSYFTDVKPGARHYREIQYLAAHGFRARGDELKPEAPTTRGELLGWLKLLAERAAPASEYPEDVRGIDGSRQVRKANPAYMGEPADAAVLARLQHWAETDAPITRAEFASWLTRLLPDFRRQIGARGPANHFVDIVDPAIQSDAEALYGSYIEPTLWDGAGALEPDGRVRFQPSAPLRHDDLFAALYIAQIGLGPLFYDHPIDMKNGRKVPSEY